MLEASFVAPLRILHIHAVNSSVSQVPVSTHRHYAFYILNMYMVQKGAQRQLRIQIRAQRTNVI